MSEIEERSITGLSYFDKLVLILKCKKGCLEAIFSYLSVILIFSLVLSWPTVVIVLYFNGDSLLVVAGISLMIITAAVVWALLLRKILVDSFRRANRSLNVSFNKREVVSVLTPEAIQFYENVIASKDEEFESEPQENNPYDISVSTKFLSVVWDPRIVFSKFYLFKQILLKERSKFWVL